jgi:hypothetical protein
LERGGKGEQLSGKSKPSSVIKAEERPIERQVDGVIQTGQSVAVCHNPDQSTQSEQDSTQYTESAVTPVFSSEWQVDTFAFQIMITHLQGEGFRIVSWISVKKGSMEPKHKMKRVISQHCLLFIAFKSCSYVTLM